MNNPVRIVATKQATPSMKRFVLVITTLLVCFCVNAQNQNQGFGRIQNPRAEFNPELYTKRMNEFVAREAHLTEAEQAKFFPLLNEMQNKQRQIGRQQREIMMKAFRNTNIRTDAKKIRKCLIFSKKLINIKLTGENLIVKNIF